ncbi:MAG: hypothetical protein GC178_09235 [Flavobacteriales bacterium]|nr:hypothetical protein [Flavobacteriales bacterium]
MRSLIKLRRFLLIFIGIGTVSGFSGCEVFVDMGLKDSTFEMYRAIIPGGDLNLNTLLLPGYKENDPGYRYIINYYGNDRCVGKYYAADTLNYTVEGTWSLPNPDVLRLKIDQFVDGDFKITKLDKITYLLETDANTSALGIGPPQVALKLYNRKVY